MKIDLAKIRRADSAQDVKIETLLGKRERELATADEMKTLRAQQARVDELLKQLNTVTGASVRRHIQAVKEAYAANPTAENLAKVTDVQDRESLELRFAAARTAVKDELRKIGREGDALVTLIRGRAAKIAEAEIQTVAAAEAETAARLGIEFEPSPTIGALQNLHRTLSHPSFAMGQGPRDRLRGLVKL